MAAGDPSHFVGPFFFGTNHPLGHTARQMATGGLPTSWAPSLANHPLGHAVRHMPAGGSSHFVGHFFFRANLPLGHTARQMTSGGPSHFVGPFPFREPMPPEAICLAVCRV